MLWGWQRPSPPHNIAELALALNLLIDNPDVSTAELVELVPGPDFPTGGILVESKESILRSYETGRGSFRLRAKWEAEPLKGGNYRIIVTEIPYLVSKSKLIEKIANLLNDKKLPLLDDIIDESADDVRIVLTPKSRNVDATILMESLFRSTDLEARISLNMNVLDLGKQPRVMSLKEVLQAFLNHRQEVLQRRSQHRLDQIAHRLEMLAGYLIAYLNIDEVIRIIREEDEPKDVMMAKFALSDAQAEAILNMRLRSLRKLQEIEIRKEHADLMKEQEHLRALLATPKLQWKNIKADLKNLNKIYGSETALGRRRTRFAEPPQTVIIPIEAVIEREDVTVICSAKGWIRVVKGHQVSADDVKYKDGDEGRYVLPAATTDKLLIFASNGRFYTLGIDKLPRGRGQGEPIRMMIDLDNTDEILSLQIADPEGNKNYLVASSDSRGFIVNEQDVIAQTRNGKQIMSLAENAKAIACIPVTGDSVVTIGENRKLLVFPVADLPTMSRGRGVTLQKYRQGILSDIKVS